MSPAPSDRYHLVIDIKVHPEGIHGSEVPEGHWATQAGIFVSLMYPPDGSFSMKFYPIDGRKPSPEGGPVVDSLDVEEVFKAWWLMASSLAGREDLSIGKRRFCEATFSAYAELAGIGVDVHDGPEKSN